MKIRKCGVLILLAFCLLLCSCGKKNEALYGTWEATYEQAGVESKTTLVINRDGTYTCHVYHGGALQSLNKGSYRLNGEELKIYKSKSTYTKYQFIDDCVRSGDIIFEKTDS